MKNNLFEIEKNLRAIAKRYKSIEYSLGLVIAFLMSGTSAFSEEINSIQMDNILTRTEIKNSVEELNNKIEYLKEENNKSLNGMRTELIKLMEQGEQVLKSPWSSWQFGVNYFYDNWSSSYKGKEDKSEKYSYEGKFLRSNSMIERAILPLSTFTNKTSQDYKERVERYSIFSNESILNAASSNKRKNLGNSYGIASNKSAYEPTIVLQFEVGIRPRNIAKEPIKIGEVTMNSPAEVRLSVAANTPLSISPPKLKAPEVKINLPEPNTKPFNDYIFTAGRENFNDTIRYAGWNPKTKEYTSSSGQANKIQNLPNSSNTRAPLGNYISFAWGTATFGSNDPDNPIEYYIAGNVEGIGTNNAGKSGNIAMHTVWDTDLKNIKAYLKGRALFLSMETWHSPKIKSINVGVDIDGDENTVFYMYPTDYSGAYGWGLDTWYRGGFTGKLNVDIKSQKNAIYSMMGVAGSFNITSEGNYRLEGGNNLVYSGLGYSPNFQNLIGKSSVSHVFGSGVIKDKLETGMTPVINLKNAPESYGDGNVIFYFSDLLPDGGGNTDYPATSIYSGDYANWKKSKIGIYQGEINATARIGEKLALDNNATKQTDKGNINDGKGTVELNTYVENNVGILVQSGQRTGIIPSKDLGAGNYNFSDIDKIHALYVNDIDITFGKYSKGNIMIASERGSAIDVAINDPTNPHHSDEIRGLSGSNVVVVTGKKDSSTIPIRTEAIRDYNKNHSSYTNDNKIISSVNDSLNEAATGTIIAYAKGTWKDSDTRMGRVTGADKMSNDTVTNLKDKKSEINFGVDIETSSRAKEINGDKFTPVVYMAEGGKITAKNTKAYGFGSVVAYAKNQVDNSNNILSSGEIVINGSVEAIDEWAGTDAATVKEKYKNIAALAEGKNSIVSISKNVKVNGIGAFANDKSTITIGGNASKINVGETVGLAATNEGQVIFGGGDINIGNGATKNSSAFYADANSKINITGTTNINLDKGYFLVGAAADYTKNSGLTTKYNGMENITLNVSGTGKIIKNSINENVTWTNGSSLANSVKSITKIGTINANLNHYLAYYTGGNFIIDGDAKLGDFSVSNSFDPIKMTKEKVTINSGKKVYSTNGTGLGMIADKTATSNVETSYTNNGIVDIKGGNSQKAALNVSYGYIKNNNIVKLDNGVGLYGTNGSKLENSTNAKINITGSGYGIVGLATGDSLQNFGRDNTTSGRAIDVKNAGEITISKNNSVGIYVDNNRTGISQSEILVENSGKINISGNNGVGIAIKDSKNSGNNGGKLTLSGTGSSDIKVGKNGIGIFAESSQIILNTNYGLEVKDNGVGMLLKGNSIVPNIRNVELKYTGSTTGKATALIFNGANRINNLNVNLVNSSNTKEGLTGIVANGGGLFTNNGKIKGTLSSKGYAIVGENTNILNNGDINLTSSNNIKTANIGLYTKTNNLITNAGNITMGNNNIGIYGYEVTNVGSVKVGDNSIAIYSQGSNVESSIGSKIEVGSNEAVGIYTVGSNQTITNKASLFKIGDNSFGISNVGKNNVVKSYTSNINLSNNGIFIYSSDKIGIIENETNIKTIGNTGGNYGIYSAGIVKNKGNIDIRKGFGNIGIYSTDKAGKAINLAGTTIRVGASDLSDNKNKKYSIGMAAGYLKEDRTVAFTGNIINEGTINVEGKNSLGMYAVGKGSTAYNGTVSNKVATINLMADKTVGMYLDEGAIGYNYGTIKTDANTPKNVTGVVVRNKAVFENHGKIIINSKNGYAFFRANGGIIKNYGDFSVSGGAKKESSPISKATTKMLGGVEIKAEAGAQLAKVYKDGKEVETTLVPISEGSRNLEANSVGLYMDTLVKTKPISNLAGITGSKVDLIVGAEASKKTNSKYIQVAKEIIEPFNQMIDDNSQITDWSLYSSSLTWMTTGTINQDTGLLNNIYLAKIPYTVWAGNEKTPVDKKDTYNFLDGLEQRYGVEAVGSRENKVFQKLNTIGNNEEILFYQAVDEMMGHQYANVQQRVQVTGKILDKEFNYLRDSWSNPTKDSNKVKTFGMKGEYKTDTAGVIDYKYDAYGVAYVHENEDIKLGRGTGWYTGIVHNTFKFKDIGNSKEKQLQAKVGMFKSVPFDDNNSLNWTISGDIFAGYNKIERKFLVVDEIFHAKAKYHIYGIGIKNEIGKEFRLSEGFSVRPYGAVKLEYGRVSKIKEKTGEMKLEVKGNDYLSISPEIGTELSYKHYFGTKTLSASVGVAYENELGRVANGKNKARVADTNAGWFNIRGEKEDRRGNVKVDLNVGLDNQRFGVTGNVGYDTKGSAVRGGVGLRVIF